MPRNYEINSLSMIFLRSINKIAHYASSHVYYKGIYYDLQIKIIFLQCIFSNKIRFTQNVTFS